MEGKTVESPARRKFEHVRSNVVSPWKREILESYRINDFDQILLIASASRGGSSLLFDTLRHHEETASPDGEHGKWYRLNGVCYPNLESDFVPEGYDEFNRDQLLQDMLTDVGATERDGSTTYAYDNAVLRLPLQFPNLELDYPRIRAEITRNDTKEIFESAGISSHLYDRWAEADSPVEHHPIEEPPFILSHNHKRLLQPKDFNERTLILKTSVDAYRLPWIRNQLFPDTDVKLVHLTRNPAASVNGLYDGWNLNRGFQTYDVGELDLEGYEGELWNYDLPPNAPRSGKLEEVCLEQWLAAHDHIFRTRDTFDDVLHVKFEDVLYDREATIEKVLDFVGLGSSELLDEKLDDLNTVMSTQEPERERWRDREVMIYDVLSTEDERYFELVREFGYRSEESWI